MKTRILTVEETFLIQGSGLVIAGRMTGEDFTLKIGDPIEIQTDEETFLKAKVAGIAILCRRDPQVFDNELISFSIEKGIDRTQIPNGAAIWLLDKNF